MRQLAPTRAHLNSAAVARIKACQQPAETTETSESCQTVCGSLQGVQESNGTAHLKLVALLDNHPVMRMFTMFRSRDTPRSPTSPSSNLGQEQPREPVD